MSEDLAADLFSADGIPGVPLATGIFLTPSGVRIVGDPSLEAFIESVQRCQRLANASLWCLGDLLYYGEQRHDWGETYTQAIDVTGKSVDTLMQAVRLSKAYPPEMRVPDVSWSHHRVALAVKDPVTRKETLETAAREGHSVADLRQQLAPATQRTTTCPKCQYEW